MVIAALIGAGGLGSPVILGLNTLDIGLAVIGDQDPDVGPYSKRTGNTYLGISMSTGMVSKKIQLGGINEYARVRITSIALDMLRRYLLQAPEPPV